MFEGKYNKVIIIIGIVLILIIILLLGYLGIRVMKSYDLTEDNMKAAQNMEKDVVENEEQTNTVVDNNIENGNSVNVNSVDDYNALLNQIIPDSTSNNSGNSNSGNNGENNNSGNNGSSNSGNSGTTTKVVIYKGYNMVGTIEIPKTGLKCPVLESASSDAIEVAVAVYAGVGLNKVGNTVITGHNYKNGTFFSDNYKLLNGDKIYITDTSGKKVIYTIYKIYKTTPEDLEYVRRDTEGRREISLTTCTDDTENRLIIWAKAD